MSVDLKIPVIGESVREVIIAEWLKAESDDVEKDEDIVVVESDKATMELPAPESGKLIAILKQNGQSAAVGETIARLEPATPISEPKNQEAKSTPEEEVAGEQLNKKIADGSGSKGQAVPDTVNNVSSIEEDDSDERREGRPKSADQGTSDPDEEQADQGEVPTRKTAAEIDETEATGERPEALRKNSHGNREAHVAQAKSDRPISAKRTKEGLHQTGFEDERPSQESSRPVSFPPRGGKREEKSVPMTSVRRQIAERLVRAQQTTAFLTTFNEIDMSGVRLIRERFQDDFQRKHGTKLGLMSFFVKACIDALRWVPEMNAEIRDGNIVYRNYYDIGVAVGGGKGLVVPVLRNVEDMSFAEIETRIQEYSEKAKRNELMPDDLKGGTFTISNGGIYGSLLSTPIINSPQSGILGMHAIQQRPVAHGEQVVVRPMMYVALTYDHRIVDGREAVRFLKRIKECVESPARILLQV